MFDWRCKKNGFSQILKLFPDNLKLLENCYEIKLNNEDTVIAWRTAFRSDKLAAHQVHGMLSPPAKMFCRMCKISIENVVRKRDFYTKQLRTEETFDDDVYAALNNSSTSAASGKNVHWISLAIIMSVQTMYSMQCMIVWKVFVYTKLS